MIPKAILSVYHLSHFLFLFMKHTHTLSLANIYTHSLTPLLTYIHNVPLSLILSHPYPHTHYLCSSYMHSHPHTHTQCFVIVRAKERIKFWTRRTTQSFVVPTLVLPCAIDVHHVVEQSESERNFGVLRMHRPRSINATYLRQAGVNFTNVLRTASTLVDSESVKNTVKSSVSFYAFGICTR